MTLKEKNDVLEDVVDASLRQLSKEYSKETGEPHLFEYWSNTRATDKDGNICFQGVLDVRKMDVKGKVLSFKRVYDRWLIQRPNEGTVEKPKLGKQQNMEEHRNTCLREVLGKSVATFAMGMALRSKEQIQELYAEAEGAHDIVDTTYPVTPDNAFESIELTAADVEAYENRDKEQVTEGQTYSEAKD